MNKDFELLLKVISKGTIDTVEEFEAFWENGYINDAWTELSFDIFGYDRFASGNGRVARIYIDIFPEYESFQCAAWESYKETIEEKSETDEEIDEEEMLVRFISEDFDRIHNKADLFNYLEEKFKSDNGYWYSIDFDNKSSRHSSSESFIEFIKNNCNNDFEKYLYLRNGIFKIVDEEDIKSDEQDNSIKIKDFLDNFASND